MSLWKTQKEDRIYNAYRHEPYMLRSNIRAGLNLKRISNISYNVFYISIIMYILNVITVFFIYTINF